MIPEAIKSAFRWWGKHPWNVFWVYTFIVIIWYYAAQVLAYFFVALILIWLGSLACALVVTWRQSKLRAVLAVIGVPIGVIVIHVGVGILLLTLMPLEMRKRGHDAEVKSNLRNAATSQEAYFVDNRTYTNKISSLRGFKQSANVNITMETTKTTFVITGSTIKGCKTNTGTLTYNSTTEAINGTPCSRVGIFRKLFLRLFGGN